MASQTAAPIGNPSTSSDIPVSKEPRAQSKSSCTTDENKIATNSRVVEQDADHCAHTESTADCSTRCDSGQDEALDASTSGADYSDDEDSDDGSSTSSETNEEPTSPVDQTASIVDLNDNSSSSPKATETVYGIQKISHHTSQILDRYFLNNGVLNFEDSLWEEWANLESLAAEDGLWQAIESGAVNGHVAHKSSQLGVLSPQQSQGEASNINLHDGEQSSQSLPHNEHYSEKDCQPAAISTGYQRNDELTQNPGDEQGTQGNQNARLSDELLNNDDDLEPGYQPLDCQQYFEYHDNSSNQPAPRFSGGQEPNKKVCYDEKYLQSSSNVPEREQYSQVRPDQESSTVHTEHQIQCQPQRHHQQIFEEQSFLPRHVTSNSIFNTYDPSNIFDSDDDDATIDEEEPETPVPSIEDRMADLKKQIELTQARTQATLDKISKNEQRILEINAMLKQKRKRTHEVDEFEEAPAKKTKNPIYRRPSTRKEPKVKATKGTKRGRTTGSPIEFIQYVPEDLAQTRNSSNNEENLHGLGIKFYSPAPEDDNSYAPDATELPQDFGSLFQWIDESEPRGQNSYQQDVRNYSQSAGTHSQWLDGSAPQVQNSYQSGSPNYAQHVGSQFSNPPPAVTQTRYASAPNVASYTQTRNHQYRDMDALLDGLDDVQYPADNYGSHAAQPVAANGYPEFPFDTPDGGSMRWNGY